MNTISYPINSTTNTGYYLSFRAYDYAKAQVAMTTGIREAVTSGGAGFLQPVADFFKNSEGGSTGAPGSLSRLFSSSQNGNNKDQNVGTGENADKQVENSAVGSVYLYLPPKLEYKYGADWQKMSFGALGSVFSDGKEAGANILKGIGATGAKYLGEQLQSALKNIPKVESLDLDNYLGASFGVVFNDNTLQTFDKMQTRQFQFDYLMVARNIAEENAIKKIIRFFKIAMHPTAEDNSRNNSLTLGYPYVFRIRPAGSYKGDSFLSFLPQTKYCALVGLNVDYTPDNVISLTPGKFVQAVRISLSFNELTSLTRNDVEKYEDNTP